MEMVRHRSFYYKTLLNLLCKLADDESNERVLTLNYMKSCPSPKHLFPETVRKPLRELVSGVCLRSPSTKGISAVDFRVCVLYYICNNRNSIFDLNYTVYR